MATTIMSLLRKSLVNLNENLENIMTAINIRTTEKLQKSHMQRAIDDAVTKRPDLEQIVLDLANGMIIAHKSKPSNETLKTPQPYPLQDPNTVSDQTQISNTDLTH